MVKKKIKRFRLAASYTIGSHILPGKPISDISEKLHSKIELTILACDKIIDGVKRGIYNLGLIETPIFDDALVYKEWMKDELIICSNVEIPKSIGEDELINYRLIARHKDSLTRMVISNFFANIGLSHKSFKSIREIDNATAVIQSVKWSRPNRENPTVALVSEIAIEEELQRGGLYKSRIKNHPLMRSFYLIYNKENPNNINIDDIIETLQNYKYCS